MVDPEPQEPDVFDEDDPNADRVNSDVIAPQPMSTELSRANREEEE